MLRRAPLLLVLLAAPLLIAAKCPLQVGDGNGGNGGGNGGTSGLDVGGSDGALWISSCGSSVGVTLVDGERRASGEAQGPAPLTLLGQSIDVAAFCWRTDVICPQHLLPEQLAMAQQQGVVLLGVNRRGPLAAAPQGAALAGELSGRELVVPLIFGEGACAPQQGSALQATVQPGSDASRGVRLDGRITLVYTGACLGISGAAAVSPEALLALSVSVTATRADAEP